MNLKSLAEILAVAPRDKAGSVLYPLECGCKSAHYHNFCPTHQAEETADRRRLMGIADLTFTHRDFTDLPALGKALHAIKLQLISNPTKSCLIKIIPGGYDEPHARQPD